MCDSRLLDSANQIKHNMDLDFKGLSFKELDKIFPNGVKTQEQIDAFIPFRESEKTGIPISELNSFKDKTIYVLGDTETGC